MRISILKFSIVLTVRRTGYFFFQHSPLPFKVGAIFQLSVDFGAQSYLPNVEVGNLTDLRRYSGSKTCLW